MTSHTPESTAKVSQTPESAAKVSQHLLKYYKDLASSEPELQLNEKHRF